jgi:lambda family phage portal protein
MPDGGPRRVLRARYDAGYPSDFNPSPPTAGSGDSELYAAGQRLRDWARYLAKNSSIVKAVLDARQAKAIGPGLRYEPMVTDRKGVLLTKLNAAIRYELDQWARAADVTGELARAEVERVVFRDWDVAGEVFARKVYRGRSRERLGYQVQLIRSELVPYGWLGRGGATMGIERDDWGAPQRYWVYPYSPAAYTWTYAVPALVPVAVPAEQMVHLRRQEELDQTRGVTLFHAVIFRASDIAEYQQSHRRAARASANLFASINRSMDYDPSTSGDPEGTGTNALGNSQSEINLLDLTLLDWMKQGESVNFHSPAHPNQNAPEFVNQELRQFAAACRVAFSWIAYVFDRAYAAQRTELIHAWEMIQEDRAHFIRDFAFPVLYREPLRLALLEGRLPARELRRADPRTLYDVRIEGPAMPTIDPVKDRQSAQLDQDMGWDSRPAIIRRFGRDPSQVDAEREQDPYQPPAERTLINDAPEADEEQEDVTP